MLRICYSDNGEAQRFRLCGRLAGPWVDELRACWQYARKTAPRSSAVLDLSEVTFIDEAGEALLSDMRDAGVEFAGAGVETRDILECLGDTGAKPLRRSLGGYK